MHDDPDKLLEARIGDMLDKAARDHGYVYSAFLDERQCAAAERLCRTMTDQIGGGEILYRLWGGYDGAQRKMLCVYSEYCSDYIMQDYPIKCLTFTYRREDKLTHRDFLGSFMGMRLKREVTGDIIIKEGITQCFVTEIAAKLICSEVAKIGRTGVKITDDRPFELDASPSLREINGSIASLRLDCVVSLAAGVSRGNAVKLIRSEKVSVNHIGAFSPSEILKEGDILSVRGSGRYVLSSVGELTKKGRLHVTLHKYI